MSRTQVKREAFTRMQIATGAERCKIHPKNWLIKKPHTCPFKMDIHNSAVECNCCVVCKYECGQDI